MVGLLGAPGTSQGSLDMPHAVPCTAGTTHFVTTSTPLVISCGSDCPTLLAPVTRKL
jgi:hypothetical protein